MPNAGAGRWLPLAIVFTMIAAGTAPPCGAAHLVSDSGKRIAPGHPSGDAPRKDQEAKVEVFLGARMVGAVEQSERLQTLSPPAGESRVGGSVKDYGDGRTPVTSGSESSLRCRCLSEAPFRSDGAGTVKDYLKY